jgi:hypothetical protein
MAHKMGAKMGAKMGGEVLRCVVAAMLLVQPAVAQSNDSGSWGALQEFAGRYWIQSAAKPTQYLRYEWETQDSVLTFNGLDSDGVVISGQFTMDPSNSKIFGVVVRKGQIANYAVQVTATTLELTGADAGAEVRQTFSKRGVGNYSLQLEEKRRGKWVPVRTLDYLRVSAEMVKALGWIEQNPAFEAEAAAARQAAMAASPSFLSRVGTALQDGAVAGVEEGVQAGVSNRISNAIGPKKETRGGCIE